MNDDSEDFERPHQSRERSLCPCKSQEIYADCCMSYHQGHAKPETAEQLMRSRYSAYFFRLVDYLVSTTHPDKREPNLKALLEETIDERNWQYLTITATSKGTAADKVGKVKFIADYFFQGQRQKLHEHSRFKRYKGAWKYLDAKG